MSNRRTYFRIRRIGAAELLRLQAEGHEVHAEAIEWAKMTIDGIDDVGGRPPAKERTEILALLAKHPEDGRTPEQVADGLGNVTVKTMQNVLYNLRKQGQCAVVKSMGRAIYFPDEYAANAQRPRLERERQAVYDAARVRVRVRAKKPKDNAMQAHTVTPAANASSTTRCTKLPVQAHVQHQERPDVSMPSTRGQHVQVVYPPHVRKEERPTPRALVDRFGVDDPQARIPGGFHAEWMALRAGGAEA